jgi:anti-sigma B factor antagonist
VSTSTAIRPFLTVTARPVPPDAVVVAVRGEVDLVSGPLLRDFLLGPSHPTPDCRSH